jgi:hypothetical protein
LFQVIVHGFHRDHKLERRQTALELQQGRNLRNKHRLTRHVMHLVFASHKHRHFRLANNVLDGFDAERIVQGNRNVVEHETTIFGNQLNITLIRPSPA